MSIAENLNEIRSRIAEACLRAGRSPESVRLIAVSKTKPVSMIREALAAGQKSFGENYVQEAVEKVEQLPEVDWHFIGSLQTNKAKFVVGRFSLVHSVDRQKLADVLAKAAETAGVVQDVLIELNVGGEETKHGVSFEEAPALIDHILGLRSLRLRGLMALPPLTEDERVARANFARLREALEKWRNERLSGEAAALFTELSMGTSSDYEWAILEGATMVRVGTSIFGAREYAR